MRADMAAEEERKKQIQAEEVLREKREAEARNALRIREEQDQRLARQRQATQDHLDSQRRPMPTVSLATAPPPEERRQHPMVSLNVREVCEMLFEGEGYIIDRYCDKPILSSYL